MTTNPAQLRLLREQAFAQAHPVLLDQLRKYKGRNAFVLQMVKKLDDWGGLTEGQAIACNRMLATAKLHEDRGDAAEAHSTTTAGNPTSEHVGTVKERLRDQCIRVAFCRLIRQPEFPRGAVYLVKMETAVGDQLTWFTENKQEPFQDFRAADFTVKEHEIYHGMKNTKVSRVVFK